MQPTYEQLAQMIDHSLLHPTLTDQEIEDGCRIAVRYGVASVCIKPYAVKRAVELLRGSGVRVGAVIGFPHGNSSTRNKVMEAEEAAQAGGAEIDMVIYIGTALGGDWAYVRDEIKAVNDVNFKIRRGEIYGIVGESGCGKTTTGRTEIGRAHV
jgi:deoxyribose-phosphate aldolase